MLNATYALILSVIILNAVMLNIVARSKLYNTDQKQAGILLIFKKRFDWRPLEERVRALAVSRPLGQHR
jgi:hypothetical protein